MFNLFPSLVILFPLVEVYKLHFTLVMYYYLAGSLLPTRLLLLIVALRVRISAKVKPPLGVFSCVWIFETVLL